MRLFRIINQKKIRKIYASNEEDALLAVASDEYRDNHRETFGAFYVVYASNEESSAKTSIWECLHSQNVKFTAEFDEYRDNQFYYLVDSSNETNHKCS